MPNKLRYCPLCKKYDARTQRIGFTRIYTAEREARLREGFRLCHNGEELDPSLSTQLVHKKCYNKIIQYLPSTDQPNSLNVEQNSDENNEEEDQSLLVESRSRAVIPSNRKTVFERSKRSCILCHSYGYSHKDRITQIVSNSMATKLAQGYFHRYKRSYGKSLLDAFIHDSCYNKLYSSYQSRCRAIRNHRNIDQSTNLSIDELFSTPLAISTATINPNTELSARSCLFRPCIQRLTPEEIEFYTKRNSIKKIYSTAEIRYLSSKPTDHNSIPNIPPNKLSANIDKLYDWLIEHLKSSEYPVPINDVVIKYKEFSEEDDIQTVSERTCRTRLKTYLEKFYPNEFVFPIPSKRDGTYIALNDINYYLRYSIKNAEKEKSAETSIVSTVIAPPTTQDYERETCEIIMKAIRKIRLYIRDPKHVNSTPSFLMQNLISLITASEKQFDKISHNYDFYRMIDENLFDNTNQNLAPRFDKTIRNMSLASDLISARHDNQISQKHFLLADEIFEETFHCTPRQVISLLNRYGHTCSYSSYRRMKNLLQRTTNELGENYLKDEDKSSDSELELMEL